MTSVFRETVCGHQPEVHGSVYGVSDSEATAWRRAQLPEDQRQLTCGRARTHGGQWYVASGWGLLIGRNCHMYVRVWYAMLNNI